MQRDSEIHPAAIRAAYNFYRFSPRDEIHPAVHNLADIIHAEYAFVPGLVAALAEIEAMHDSRNLSEAREKARAALAAAEKAEDKP